MKKASSRSQRGNKGIKGKHVLQICVLLGVCIWLIYQVKYSHDKKQEFFDKDVEKSISKSEDGLVKLGRKDLLPKVSEEHVDEDEDEEDEKESKSKVVEEEEEVVEEDEEDKSKLGEEVDEEDSNKHEEDDIDEQDQSKDTDELLEEEKEKESDHGGDEIDMTVDEAREEHYKADDASSAVSHESRVLKTEKLTGNSTETDVKIQTEPVLKVREAESGDDSVDKTATEVKDGDGESSSSEVKSVVTELRGPENNTSTDTSEVKIQKEPVLKLGEVESDESVDKTATEVKDSDNESSNSETRRAVTETVNGNSTESILEASRFLNNETEIMRERSQEHDKETEDGAPPSGSSNESDHYTTTVSANITSNGDEFKNSTSLTENISSQNITELQENSKSESGDDDKGTSTEQIEEADDDDTSEPTVLQEEKEALTDTQTLPDIRVEGNEEDEEEDGITSE